jgi:hypothetical protein
VGKNEWANFFPLKKSGKRKKEEKKKRKTSLIPKQANH